MLGTILIVILVMALLGVLPRWSHSREWGYAPAARPHLDGGSVMLKMECLPFPQSRLSERAASAEARNSLELQLFSSVGICGFPG
jgi:hypothetical protein